MSRVFRTIKSVGILAPLGFALIASSWMAGNFLKRHDRSIVQSLEVQLASDERFRDVRAEVKEGIVLLTGTVKVLQDKREILNKVGDTDHVRSVKDQVSVDTTWIPDRFLRKQLYQTLHAEQVHALGLKVRKGVVTIRGEIRTKADQEHVLALVSGTEGVKAVTDQTILRR